jgi:hypothetical protein
LPYLLNNEEVDRLGAEWRIYQLADILEDWIKTSTNSSNNITEYVPIRDRHRAPFFALPCPDDNSYKKNLALPCPVTVSGTY